HLQQRVRSGYWKATTETQRSWRAERTSARLLPGLVSLLIFFVGRIEAGQLLSLLHLLNQPALQLFVPGASRGEKIHEILWNPHRAVIARNNHPPGKNRTPATTD